LVSGTLPAPSQPNKKVTIGAVARQANVSVATVSMVLNKNPRISTATQVRVQNVMDELGYRPNRLAQGLSSKYTQVLAVLVPPLRHGFGDPYFGELISGICDRAGKLGYKVMLEQAKPDFIREKQHLQIFERRFVDGLLCLGMSDRHPFLMDFVGHQCPVVIVDNYFPQWNLDYVVSDYRAGTEQAMNYLLQLGHRKIGLIAAAQEITTSRDLLTMFRKKLTQAELDPQESWVADGRFTEEGGAEAAAQLLERHKDMTAVLAGNTKMALGAVHHITHSGRQVPQDVSVVGFDDLRHSAFVTPALTTVHLPLYEVGARACGRLVERVHGTTDRVADVLGTHLVVRESTAMAASVLR
jgi:DNA-binding LacI/PurR family transcriptional regulator